MKFSQVLSNPKSIKISQSLGTPLPCRERDCASNHGLSEQTKKDSKIHQQVNQQGTGNFQINSKMLK